MCEIHTYILPNLGYTVLRFVVVHAVLMDTNTFNFNGHYNLYKLHKLIVFDKRLVLNTCSLNTMVLYFTKILKLMYSLCSGSLFHENNVYK